jgi:hypothetical protein
MVGWMVGTPLSLHLPICPRPIDLANNSAAPLATADFLRGPDTQAHAVVLEEGSAGAGVDTLREVQRSAFLFADQERFHLINSRCRS